MRLIDKLHFWKEKKIDNFLCMLLAELSTMLASKKWSFFSRIELSLLWVSRGIWTLATVSHRLLQTGLRNLAKFSAENWALMMLQYTNCVVEIDNVQIVKLTLYIVQVHILITSPIWHNYPSLLSTVVYNWLEMHRLLVFLVQDFNDLSVKIYIWLTNFFKTFSRLINRLFLQSCS